MSDSAGRRKLSAFDKIGLLIALVSLVVGLITVPWGDVREFFVKHFAASRPIPTLQGVGTEVPDLGITARPTTDDDVVGFANCDERDACFYVMEVGRNARITGLDVDDIVVKVDDRSQCAIAMSQPDLAAVGATGTHKNLEMLGRVANGSLDAACAFIVRDRTMKMQLIVPRKRT